MQVTRRGLLKAFAVAPAAALIPFGEAATAHQFMPGDLVDYAGPKGQGSFIGSRVVKKVEGSTVWVNNGYYGKFKADEPFEAAHLKLFEGLPGNRVNNPSMRHRLFNVPGTAALAYPEDLPAALAA